MKFRTLVPTAVLALALAACGSASSSSSSAGSSTVSGISASSSASPTTSESDTDAPADGASSAACGEKTSPHPKLALQLPTGFPTVTGWTSTQAVTQGRTHAIRGSLRGDAGDIVAVRDAAVARIVAAGYIKTGSDQEPGSEADADFRGPHEGNINVRVLCRDYLVLTYTIEQ
jgi:hypothetical protein